MAQWNKQTGDFLDQQRSLFEVIGVATSDGNIVSADNPFPVSIGGSSVTITGNVTIPGTVEISNEEGNPIPTHAHIFDASDNEYGTSNPFPVTVGAGSTVNVSVLNEISVSGIGSTVNVSVAANNPLPVSLANNFGLDLFGRLKISHPYTLFDDVNRYGTNGEFDNVVVGSGSTVGIITAQSSTTLSIGTTAGCSIIRETKRVFPYLPGKSLQVFQTFVLNPAKSNLVQRVGYASSENGIMLELNGSQINIIKRTGISGVGTTVTVPQSEWNVDKLDGTGVSGVNLDLTKAQILFTEYEWLGVGAVRVGFINENGSAHIAHIFNHANVLDSVYMTTATLPCRYEILNTGITTSSSTMKQICVSVQSNGGYEKKVAESIARRTSATTVGTSFEPLVSIRLAPGREDAVVIAKQYSVLPTSTDGDFFEVVLIKNATLTDASWTSSDKPNVQQDTSATALTGGTIIRQDYVVGADVGYFGGSASTPLTGDIDYNWDLQLGRTQAKVSDTYTLAARVLSGTGDIIGALSFFDLT